MLFPNGQKAEPSLSLESIQPCRQLTFYEIQLATQNFDESLVIGRGGFGKVYKGTISNGARHLVAAIKRLDSTSNQGAVEFWAEVEMLSKLRHCHLVSLIGYCNDGQEMILVYEYMPRGTLEDHLHRRRTLPWVRRLKICIGAARGLDYLHTGTGIKHGVIHRDVKSSNILLDYSWAAKISDFGLSKIGPTNQPSTYVNTLVKGTFGYLDPDYFATGRLTRKSDVYAFGVVLFEVLCGKRAVDRSLDEEQWGLARWAQDSMKEGRVKQIVDSNMRGRISHKCLKEFARLADRCLHSHPKHRPTMSEVVSSLESILALQEKTNKALQPGGMTIFGRKMPMFLIPSNGENSVGGSSLKSLDLYLDTVEGESRILHRFEFETISVATENFSEANKISEHVLGSMYKGRLQNGQGIAIAIERPYSDSKYEEHINEASLLVKLEHENLAQLLGYCVEGTTLFLVYEFVPYSSLGLMISDPRCTLLDWKKLYKIILGVARVLVYLHKHAPFRIIHCDVRPVNILLDESLDPKLSGFGIARCLAINGSDGIDVDVVRGKMRHIAPEYAIHGRLSTKADVFCFGALVLETICVRKTYECIDRAEHYFIRYVWRKWYEGTSSHIIDPRIDGDSSSITRSIHIALLCLQDAADDRPTMEEVVGMLLGSSCLTFPIPKVPAWIIDEDSDSMIAVCDDNDCETVEEFISELHPR